MDSKAWQDMTPRERDVLVAECVMGWTRMPLPIADSPSSDARHFFAVTLDVGAPHCWITPDGQYRYLQASWPINNQELPRYTTTPDVARLVEDEIERRGQQRAYTTALMDTIDAVPFDDDFWLWQALRATPDQRCHAALKAIGALP